MIEKLLGLKAPLNIKDIDFRIQSINNGKYATILAYKDARVDMNRLDEVVGSKGWCKELLDNNTQLLGVEMEAGGVCAAAKKHNVDVAVVRGISDHADPSKKDDNWRKISMTTVALLLEEINYQNIFNTEGD